MAIRGVKPKKRGTTYRAARGERAAQSRGAKGAPQRENALPYPPGVKDDKAQKKLWDGIIRNAYWLTPLDSPKAHVWVALHAEFESAPAAFPATKIAQLRALGQELGLDPSSRDRMGIGDPMDSEDQSQGEEFFG